MRGTSSANMCCVGIGTLMSPYIISRLTNFLLIRLAFSILRLKVHWATLPLQRAYLFLFDYLSGIYVQQAIMTHLFIWNKEWVNGSSNTYPKLH